MPNNTNKSWLQNIRVVLGVGGLLAIIAGALILVWPDRTAMALTWIIAAYAFFIGLVYVGVGIWAKERGGWARVGNILLGLLFLIGAVIAILNLGATTAWLMIFLGIMVGILWIAEGVMALSTLHHATSKVWPAIFAVISILAGLVLLFSPLYVVALWWMLGISLVVLGVLQVIRAFKVGRE
ncbi:HdeD family acid-resistance protein [Gulosibacter molinativorax]|uniref:DUF308 domain-containing protein n=1 Tax=Gulosibacter molinativorax TaxID=256821 RepID=A0ABT7C8P5_9MICO|nr:DUF308 domain-containing protein [Gulosibacter molinativorax]MDJ1371542.1 hypothetical protein [Gulosibacter molinativorax]QUY62484.1 Acid-resistance membrane protein [Gulosibacter molinativorax]